MLPFAGGHAVELPALLEQIRSSNVEGITLLGGELLSARHVTRGPGRGRESGDFGLSVTVFSGYTLDGESRGNCPILPLPNSWR